MADDGQILSEDELIGAYYDGELNEADRMRAERLLSADPARRRELDELVNLTSRLQSLPRATLGDGFVSEVLRRAERELLTRPRSGEVQLANSTETAASTTGANAARSGLPWPRGRRPWLWASMALAASVMLVVFFESNQFTKRVAMELPTATSARTDLVLTADGKSTPLSDGSKAVAEGVVTEPILALPPSAAPMLSPSAAATQAAGVSSPVPAPLATSAKGAAASGLMVAESMVVTSDQQIAAQFATLGYALPVNRHLAQQAVAVESLPHGAILDDSLLVVEVEVDRTQLTSDPFSQVLLANGVQCATQPQVQQANLFNNLHQSQQARSRRSQPATNRTVTDEDTDLVYVVASAEQLQNTLASLQTVQSTYRRVTIRGEVQADRRAEGAIGDAKRKQNLSESQAAGAPKPASMQPSETTGLRAATVPDPGAKQVRKAGEIRNGDGSTENAKALKYATRDLADKVLSKTQPPGESLAESRGATPQGWFNRLTLPPVDALLLRDEYFGGGQRNGATASRGTTPAITVESNRLKENESRPVSADGLQSVERTVEQAAQDRQSRGNEASLRRALFVFRVVGGTPGETSVPSGVPAKPVPPVAPEGKAAPADKSTPPPAAAPAAKNSLQ